MSSRIVKLVPVAALSLVMVPGLANAQAGSTRAPSGDSAATAKPGDSAKLAPADRRFVEQAARGGAAEVAMGKLAQQKASSDQVKQFGEHMVQDHSKANEQLKQLVQDKGVSLPQEPSKAQQEEMAKLGKMSGAEFDRQYMAQMVSDHRKTVAEFKRAAESAQDSEIKAFASKTLPTLQEHLSQAQTIRDSVKSASR